MDNKTVTCSGAELCAETDALIDSEWVIKEVTREGKSGEPEAVYTITAER